MAGLPNLFAENVIGPEWVHGKRAIVEPERRPMAAEVVERVCECFGG